MENITVKYIKIIENKKDKNNYIKIRVYYDLGGYNWATHKEKPRGYYISIQPVERGGNLEGFTAFTGFYDLLEPCARKSKKAEANALEKAIEREPDLINYICAQNGYILEGKQ